MKHEDQVKKHLQDACSRNKLKTSTTDHQSELKCWLCRLKYTNHFAVSLSAPLQWPTFQKPYSNIQTRGKSGALGMLQREERAREHKQDQSQSPRDRSWGPNRSHPRQKRWFKHQKSELCQGLCRLWCFRVYRLRIFPPYGNGGVKQSSGQNPCLVWGAEALVPAAIPSGSPSPQPFSIQFLRLIVRILP